MPKPYPQEFREDVVRWPVAGDRGPGVTIGQVAAARNLPDEFDRLCIEMLSRTGVRKGELLGLTVDSVVQIGSAHWLRIPIGKLHNDRYVPLRPQLKTMIDAWLDHPPNALEFFARQPLPADC